MPVILTALAAVILTLQTNYQGYTRGYSILRVCKFFDSAPDIFTIALCALSRYAHGRVMMLHARIIHAFNA